MLENCQSGSEGGGAYALPTPIIARHRLNPSELQGTVLGLLFSYRLDHHRNFVTGLRLRITVAGYFEARAP